MRRTLIGWLFILHGLAHSALGFWAASLGPEWLVTPLWWIAQVGFVAAGAGLVGVTGLRRLWAPLGFAAALSSIALFSLYGHLALMIGLVVDVFVLVAGLQWGEPAALDRLRGRETRPDAHPVRHAVATWLTGAVLVYMSTVILLRPWQLTWGSTQADRVATMPGDLLVDGARYRMDRVVTIEAPADSVWQWLVQIGQDRAGFYSYDRLERLFGADIHNADQVHPEWQARQAGDFVRATQPGYLGGRFGSELGWRVAEVVPGRAIVLERWGAFVLHPVDATTTKLHIRLRGDGTPTVVSSLFAPIGLLVFEPAHFIMERGMMLGIKRRAEGFTRAG
jgi:hypothetical protein